VTYRDYLRADFNELMGTFSPDGRRVAYVSDEMGRPEVYIRAFPSGEQKLLVSEDGGTEPRWAPDGSAVYYLSGSTVMRASVGNGEIIERQALFSGAWISASWAGFAVMTNWDVHPDGTPFVFIRNPRMTAGSDFPLVPIEVVADWFEELKRLAPVD
jgi:dipeptidyl aminopeptidase/acylaminoacyl peptidase